MSRPDIQPQTPLRIGTLGAARITPKALLAPAATSPDADVVAVAARNRDDARSFAAKHQIPHVMDSYESLVASELVEAVYNPLPISGHADWTLAAIRHGKHVLCEKPFTLNEQEAETVARAADDAGVVVVEAFHTRYHPIMLRAIEILQDGQLGEVQRAEAFFDVPIDDTPEQIRYRYELGGGATMDIGCYPLHWLRHVLGAEPHVLAAEAVVGPPHVDVAMRAELDVGGVPAEARCDMRAGAKWGNGFKVIGSEATLDVWNPLVPQNGHHVKVTRPGEVAEGGAVSRRTTFEFQLERFVAAVRSQQAGASWSLPTDAHDGVVSMRVIDSVYEAAGLPRRGT